jgi:hypothetical protein
MGGATQRGIAVAPIVLALLAGLAAIPAAGRAAILLRPPAPPARACETFSLGSEESAPQALAGPLEAGLLASYAVLRRAAVAADQPPQLNSLELQLGYELSAYYPAYTRQLLVSTDGRRFLLFVGLPRVPAVPPARCLPRRLRAQRPRLVAEQLQHAREVVFCIAAVGRSRGLLGGAGAGCLPFASVADGEEVIADGFSTRAVVELVPDGVATVRLHYRDGGVITAAVSEGAYAYLPPQGPVRMLHNALRNAGPAHELGRTHLGARERRSYENALSRLIRRARLAATPTAIEWLGGEGGLLRTIVPHTSARGIAPASIIITGLL